MFADEQRNRKPYAVPVQYIPYHRITDIDVRNITEDVTLHMKQYILQWQVSPLFNDHGISMEM